MIALWIAFGCLAAFVAADRVFVYFNLVHNEKALRDLRRRNLDTNIRQTEAERRLRAVEDALRGDIFLLLEHLGLAIQKEATTTTPRRLVPKGKGGKE